MLVSGKHALQVVMDVWLPCWRSHANDGFPEDWHIVPALKPTSVPLFRAGLSTFSEHVGLGWDLPHPATISAALGIAQLS